ncbi:MAG: hypothetical protein H6Q55_1973, partial [Deltaproteobacteria bacterium]|nr:hypothetical protein [Deltaproteobacteria bacterium]
CQAEYAKPLVLNILLLSGVRGNAKYGACKAKIEMSYRYQNRNVLYP